MADLADRLSDLLKQRGITARELSRRIGSSHGTVDAIINRRSKSPEAARLEAIARELGVSARWLLTGKDEPVVVSDRVNPTIASVAKAKGFSEETAAEASRRYFALRGTADITERDAEDLLEMTRSHLRTTERLFGGTVVQDAGTDNPLDDFKGGAASTRKRR